MFENCIWEAEDACLRFICEKLGLTYGKTGFAGIKSDNAVECGVFDIGRPYTGDMMAFPSSCYHYRSTLELNSRDRRQILKWQARLLNALPCQTTNATGAKMPENCNVEQFRIAVVNDAFTPIITVNLPVGSMIEEKTVEVFTSTVQFDTILNAGTRVSA